MRKESDRRDREAWALEQAEAGAEAAAAGKKEKKRGEEKKEKKNKD